ncbi:hypothetical protein D9611_009086 [Ephemerocybe angulata]|uniref:F-box domain-containing protein n=1 Tax=Ephemerocybe angulata TaxID=980116 RepID=A0A8H5CDI5_9AGAR|nr:hypothetical protein D9611_009086 [Tulosesus angulatus]
MAGFLRRKTKQSDVAKQPASISAPAPPPPPVATPLFARFASSSSNLSNGEQSGGTRAVSSPMNMSNHARRESTKGSSYRGGNGASSVSIASGRSQTATTSQRLPPSSFYTEERPSISRLSLEKPLPAPASPMLPTSPTEPSRRFVARGPPPVTQLKQPLRSRTSFDKPLPVPGEQAHQQPRPAPTNGRNLSLQTNFQPTPQASGRRSPAYHTNLLDDEFGDLTPQATTPRASIYRAVGNAGGFGANAGSAQDRLSVNGFDIPPEFALYQQVGALSSSPPDSGRVAAAVKPPSSGGRSTTAEKKASSSSTPQHLKAVGNPIPAHLQSTQPPPAPSSSGMGNSNSVLANSLYHSSIAPLPSRAFTDPSFVQAPQKPTDAKPKSSTRRVGYSTPSPPPPPGASPPVIQSSPYVLDNFPRPTPTRNVLPAPSQGPSPPVMPRGPRIFAAMAAADDAVPEQNADMEHRQQQAQAFSNRNGPSYPQAPQHDHAASLPSPPPSMSLSSSNGYHQPQVPLSPPMQTSFPHNSAMYQQEASPSSPSSFHTALHEPSGPDTMRTPRMNASRPLPTAPSTRPSSSPSKSVHRQSMSHQVSTPPHTPPRSGSGGRKLSKARHPPTDMSMLLSNGSTTSIISVESLHSSNHGHRTLAKVPPTPPPHEYEPPMQVDEETRSNAGIPLDDDPFAKVEGVKMLSPLGPGGAGGADPVPMVSALPAVLSPVAAAAAAKEGSIRKLKTKASKGDLSVVAPLAAAVEPAAEKSADAASASVVGDAAGEVTPAPKKKVKETPEEKEARRKERRERRAREKEAKALAKLAAAAGIASPTLEASGDQGIEPIVGEELEALNLEKAQETSFPLNRFVSNPQLLTHLLSYLSFYDWCILSSVTREVRVTLVQSPHLREEVLERYLKTVGYARWAWEDREPLSLSLQDLADYMRGVSTPSHEYARVAKMYVHSLSVHPNIRDPSLEHTVRSLTASTRAYTRVVLRLRAQAEKEAAMSSANPATRSGSTPPSASIRNGVANGFVNGFVPPSRPASRSTSRAPSPTMSTFSHSHSNGHAANGMQLNNSSQTNLGFRSPLFRLRRAPLLRVFIPSPEGDWLSDRSVLECEAECKRAGVLHLMRMGDVVWDIAVGDEGNVGRLVYDGKYLIDLDYTFNPIGDLPKYIPTLAFPPSYFHRVIRTGAVTSNPVVHVDISPWGEEIAANLQLLQDRVKTETPQGAYHNVVRWVHRSSFVIRPPARVMQRGPSVNGRFAGQQPHTPRIPIPETENLFIDAGWYGTIVVETEGTNEALADLQDRCGPRAFPPRPRPMSPAQLKAQSEIRKVFRILREKSRPGEIWIKAVGVKERIL